MAAVMIWILRTGRRDDVPRRVARFGTAVAVCYFVGMAALVACFLLARSRPGLADLGYAVAAPVASFGWIGLPIWCRMLARTRAAALPVR